MTDHEPKFEVKNRMVYDLRSGEPVATTRGLDDIRCDQQGYVPKDQTVRDALAFYEAWRIERMAGDQQPEPCVCATGFTCMASVHEPELSECPDDGNVYRDAVRRGDHSAAMQAQCEGCPNVPGVSNMTENREVTLPSRNASEWDVTCHCREYQVAGFSEGPTLDEWQRLCAVAHAAADLFHCRGVRGRWIAWKRLRSAEGRVWGAKP